MGHAPRQLQVAHPQPRAVLDVERGAPAARATAGARDQLDLEVELVALLDHALHLEPLKADEAAKVIPHPLFLLAPRSMTTQSLKVTADVSFLAPQPRPLSKTRKVVHWGRAGGPAG
jgi:hypothetical protein